MGMNDHLRTRTAKLFSSSTNYSKSQQQSQSYYNFQGFSYVSTEVGWRSTEISTEDISVQAINCFKKHLAASSGATRVA